MKFNKGDKVICFRHVKPNDGRYIHPVINKIYVVRGTYIPSGHNDTYLEFVGEGIGYISADFIPGCAVTPFVKTLFGLA